MRVGRWITSMERLGSRAVGGRASRERLRKRSRPIGRSPRTSARSQTTGRRWPRRPRRPSSARQQRQRAKRHGANRPCSKKPPLPRKRQSAKSRQSRKPKETSSARAKKLNARPSELQERRNGKPDRRCLVATVQYLGCSVVRHRRKRLGWRAGLRQLCWALPVRLSVGRSTWPVP